MSLLSPEQLNIPKDLNSQQELQPGSSQNKSEDAPKDSLVLKTGHELQQSLSILNTLQNKLEHDQNITLSDILALQETLHHLKIKIGDQEVDLEHAQNIENLKIFKEIKEGNFDNVGKLTFLTNEAAESLSQHQGVLHLDGLSSLSDVQAESLSQHQGALSLSGLSSLSDAQAESLSQHQGDLYLNGLSSLTDAQAKSLSKHQGGYLSLDGLSSLSDAQAESLSKYRGTLYIPDKLQTQIDKFKK